MNSQRLRDAVASLSPQVSAVEHVDTQDSLDEISERRS
jgi:hypothetical protein